MLQNEIKSQLAAIEKRENVTVLLAIESGSRAWGFPSPDSDYDVRFIYAHPKDWYLQVFDEQDYIELEISNDLDINGWDLKKSMALAAKGNAVLFEWLNSPIVYRSCPEVVNLMREGINAGFNGKSAFHHYFSQGKKFINDLPQPGETMKLKRFFYLLRALLCAKWIRVFGTRAPVEFEHLLNKLVQSEQKDIHRQILSLIELKSKLDESGLAQIDRPLLDYVQALHHELLDFDYATELFKGPVEQPQWNCLFRQIVCGMNK